MAEALGGSSIAMSLQEFYDRIDEPEQAQKKEHRSAKEIIQYVKDGLHSLAREEVK